MIADHRQRNREGEGEGAACDQTGSDTPSEGGLEVVTGASRLKERTTRMLEHALELAAQGYSLEKIETLLHYAGYSDARLCLLETAALVPQRR